MFDANPIAAFFSSADTKFYAALCGALWTAFKGFNWVRDIREKDLRGLKDDVQQQTGILTAGFTAMTTAVHELRSDFRTFYTSPDPLMVPVNARVARKRTKPRVTKTPAKKVKKA